MVSPLSPSLVGDRVREATLLISWQMLQHLLFEEGAVEVGVYLRRVQIAVAKHLLKRTRIDAVFQHKSRPPISTAGSSLRYNASTP